jgi:hypothetical protein
MPLPRITAAQAALLSAFCGLVGGVAGAYIAGRSSEKVADLTAFSATSVEKIKVEGDLRLEESKQKSTESLARKQFETTLIFKAVDTPNRADAIRNLRFFVRAGFLPDSEGKISALSDDELPSLSSPSAGSVSRATGATGIVSYVQKDGQMLECAAVAISAHQAITRSKCLGDANQDDSGVMTITVDKDTFLVKQVAQDPSGQISLIQLQPPNKFTSFFDRGKFREPVVKERVYFVHQSYGIQKNDIEVCNIVQNNPSDDYFTYDCTGGPGSSGAMVIAISDDALLGIHYGKLADSGRATKLGRAIAAFGSALEH